MTSQEFFEKLPVKLNNQQLEAVSSIEGPVLLLAVPGSGKTTVLVSRLGYMIHVADIDPRKILTITYTVAATHDMKRRFESYFGVDLSEEVEFRTINGICAKIILWYGRMIQKTPFTLCTDEKKLSGILSAIYQKVVREYPTDSDLKSVRTLITYIKNSMLTREEIEELQNENDLPIAEMYELYNKQLKQEQLMDYDDQMVYAYAILKSNQNVLSYFQDMFPYICVDEAQDTSKLQHAIIALLAQKTENLFMVGDEDQSIYGFRAAYPQALLHFEENHPNAKVLLMEQNFRSNAMIVDAADRFIQKNTLRHKKVMFPTKDHGSENRLVELKTRSAQYTYLFKVAADCKEETAVLYRDNECVLPLIDLLERGGVPYQIRNADMTFFTHRIVRDIRMIAAFSQDLFNTELFMQIYYKIGTYFNKQKAEMACDIARKRDIPVLDAAIDYMEHANYTLKSLKALRTNLVNLKKDNAFNAIFRIMEAIGYAEYLERCDLSESKVTILRALAGKEESIYGLCNRLDEIQKILQEKEYDRSCPFILSTIHSCKGLEYQNVYILDVFDGLFPENALKNPDKADEQSKAYYEEERRLFYVAVTRAKDNLAIFKWNESSIFIDEFFNLKKDNIKQSLNFGTMTSGTKASGAKSSRAKRAGTSILDTYQIGKNKKQESDSRAYQQFVDQIGEGVIVKHDKFGEGVVTYLEGDRVTIMFDHEEKSFYLPVLFRLGVLHYE